MRVVRLFLVGLAFLASGLLANRAAMWLIEGSARPATAERPREEAKAETVVEIGEVWESQTYPLSVPFHNPSSVKVAVAEVGMSCGCTKIEPKSFDVPPQEQFDARAIVDLTHEHRPYLGKHTGH
jgi:hypothetical protein